MPTPRDHGSPPERPPALVLVAFVVLIVLAGGNAVAIRVLNRHVEPLWGASMRFSISATLFWSVVVAARLSSPSRRALVGAALYGFLFFGVGFGLVHWSLGDVGAGLGQTLLATTPLITVGLAWAQRLEPFRWPVAAGATCSMLGVAVIFWRAVPADVPTRAVVAILVAATCWAQAGVVVKRFPSAHPAWTNAVAMAVGTVVVALATVLRREARPRFGAVDGDAWLALAYLVIPGSLIVFGLFVFVLHHWDASISAFQLVLIPLVAVPLASWIDHEPVTSVFLFGAALVLAGTAFALRSTAGRRNRRATLEHG